MAKVLLVEDDKNLREIFEMRLQAEGYDTSVASDGEEALVVAMREKPDLIIADVMMPKMSGFDMLENLRASPELAKTKAVMMTALGQAEDKERGEKLGVIKYLVKSQVTLEDFVRTVGEVLGGTKKAATTDSSAAQSNTVNINNPGGNSSMDDNTQPAAPAPMGGDTPAGGDMGGAPADSNPISGAPAGDDQMSTAQAQDAMNQQANDAMGGGAAPAPAADTNPTPADVPMGTPPADQSQPSGDEGQTPPTPPADGQDTGTPAPGGM